MTQQSNEKAPVTIADLIADIMILLQDFAEFIQSPEYLKLKAMQDKQSGQ